MEEQGATRASQNIFHLIGERLKKHSMSHTHTHTHTHTLLYAEEACATQRSKRIYITSPENTQSTNHTNGLATKRKQTDTQTNRQLKQRQTGKHAALATQQTCTHTYTHEGYCCNNIAARVLYIKSIQATFKTDTRSHRNNPARLQTHAAASKPPGIPSVTHAREHIHMTVNATYQHTKPHKHLTSQSDNM